MIKKITGYFSTGEKLLWLVSVLLIAVSFVIFDRENLLTLCASLIGVTSLIFNAKGNPVGQVLMIVFSLLYGVISFSFRYYDKMITYLGMTAPMAAIALISWLRNPYKDRKSEVIVDSLKKHEGLFMTILTAVVTLIFYFILSYLDTPNIIPSTLSVTTSFAAAYLTFRRNPFFALTYAANDIVLIVLWVLASAKDISYLSVIICFIVFLLNDIYGYISWKRMDARQKRGV